MHRKLRRLLGGLAFTAALGLLAAVPAAAATTIPVGMVEFAFNPRATVISVGDSVSWTNNGAAPHTATSVQGRFNSGLLTP
ncbi:MAG TPA: hypothetical protein VH257_17535, partial [Chloroflexota bacterium]|nr:hypothetical protein [Chloroflexota bacterium]